MDKRSIYQSIIKDYSNMKENVLGINDTSFEFIRGHRSESCSDEFDFYIKYDDKFNDIKYKGKGCILSTASINISINMVKNKTKQESLEIFKNMEQLIKMGKPSNEIGDFIIFENTSKFLNRIPCVMLFIKSMSKYFGGLNG